MAQPVYKVWRAKYKDAWYQLSQDEQNKLQERNLASLKEVGAESVLFCMSYWANEEWLGWGVEKYPSIEAVQKHADNLFAMNWSNYMESVTFLGTEYSLPE